METATITSKKIEEIQKVIQQLIDSKQSSATETSTTEHQLLLNLHSQLESLKQDQVAAQSEAKEEVSSTVSEVESKSKDKTEKSESKAGIRADDVVKELKKVEKQNKTTHWLLSALIVLTLAWQASEVSILLKLRQGINHPFKSVGNMVAGMVKRRKRHDDEAEQSSLLSKVNGTDNPLSSMDISGLMNGDED